MSTKNEEQLTTLEEVNDGLLEILGCPETDGIADGFLDDVGLFTPSQASKR